MPENKKYDITPLSDCMTTLLGENGCPWDIKQTHQSIRHNFLEEAHEVVETIDQNDFPHMKEELGDMLLQVLFHCMIAEKNGEFTFNEVVDGITQKLIRRHPHVFGGEQINDAQEVLKNWEAIKLEEKKHEGAEMSIMSKLPPSLPALMRAEKVQEKARRVGFDWQDDTGAWEKIYEELSELKDAVAKKTNVSDELGDVLFSVVNIARFVKIDAETALKNSTDKFVRRFKYIEQKARAEQHEVSDYTLAQLDNWWNEAKDLEKK